MTATGMDNILETGYVEAESIVNDASEAAFFRGWLWGVASGMALLVILAILTFALRAAGGS